MKKRLEITLMSDLCAGVGKHFAAVIDLDTAIDEYGIPFIPSRRLKGCMREVAVMIDSEKINEIFGRRGFDVSGSLSITDARIEGYNNIVEALIAERNITPNSVAELFCSVRSETAIVGDTVKDGSLRFIRVVNKHSPIDSRPLKFIADIEFDDCFENEIQKICKGLRNIGYRRNRGFGAVQCTLVESTDEFVMDNYEFKDDTNYEFKYTVCLQSDLMLPSTDTNHSLDYIPGTSVMGALASRYKGSNFNEVFLSGNVHFGNLYISDKNSSEYVPAPRFLAKVKAATEIEDKGIKNLIAVNDAAQKNERNNESAKQDKPLKNGYINPTYGYRKPKTKIVYHNALSAGGTGLYTQYCLCNGQYFKGSIIADGKAMKEIYPLFREGTISFGRSKTAQYAKCKIVKTEEKMISECSKENPIKLTAGSTAAYICESDVVLTNENGTFTTELSELLKALTLAEPHNLRKETSIATRTVSGYNSKWNLKKPQFPAIRAGSVVVFTVDSDREDSEYLYIGEKQNEGFGKVKLLPEADKLIVSQTVVSDICTNKAKNPLVLEIKNRRIDDMIISKAMINSEKIALNASQTGRITLMCKEAESYEDFISRISGIKTEAVNNEVLSHFGEERLKSIFADIFKNTPFESCLDGQNNEEKEFVWKKYRKYIVTMLTVRKYKIKSEGKVSE